jgi:hypothetical protein
LTKKAVKKTIILIFTITSLFSCKQIKKSTPETFEVETVNTIRKYEYVDSMGKRLIIENSLPRGGEYTDHNGKEYWTPTFWTRIINETENPVELKIDFSVAYEVPSLPGKHFKILIPPDTMTLDKEPLQDYGIKDLKTFLDNNIHKPSSLKRTIDPKGSSGFYVVILYDKGVSGPTRTGLNLKGQNLFYKVARYQGKQGVSLADEIEINCGSFNLKNLVRQK